MKTQGYGLPLICPACPEKGNYYGMLKVPGNKATPCPNCGTPLISKKKYAAVVTGGRPGDDRVERPL